MVSLACLQYLAADKLQKEEAKVLQKPAYMVREHQLSEQRSSLYKRGESRENRLYLSVRMKS